MGHDFEIYYRPGLENQTTDALSRCNGELQEWTISVPLMLDWEAIREESAHDEGLRQIKVDLLKDGNSHHGYSIVGKGLLY